MQLVKCYLRAAELEMQAAQESLRSDLAMAGLKAQVLGRTEVLEARERERREVVLVVAPLPHVLGGRAMP